MNRIRSILGRHRTRLLLAAALGLLGLALRLHMAATGPVEFDEPVYLDAAILYAADLRGGDFIDILRNPYNYEHPIFSKLVYGVALAMRRPAPGLDGGDMPENLLIRESPYFNRFLALRSVSVGFGSLAVFLLALLNPLAGLLLAVQTYAVKYTSVIYLEALPLAFSLAGVLAYARARLDFSAPGQTQRQRAWLALSAVCLGLAVAGKYIYGLAGLAVALDLLISARSSLRRLLKPGALMAAAALIAFLIANPAAMADPDGHLSRSVAYSLAYQNDYAVRSAGYPFWQPLSWLTVSIPRQPAELKAFFTRPGDFWLALDEIILPLGLISFASLLKRQRVFAIWLAAGLAFLLTWNTKWPQYILAILPPLCLSASLGMQVLWEGTRRFGFRDGRKRVPSPPPPPKRL